jgi:hypothetical protein
MRKSMATEISWDCGNVQLATSNLFSICLDYCGNVKDICQSVHSNAHLTPLKGISSEKLLIIAEIFSLGLGFKKDHKKTHFAQPHSSAYVILMVL